MKIDEIRKKAIEVFGQQTIAENWLLQPARGLGYRIPAEVMRTKNGRREVYVLLSQLEYCVYI